MDIWLIIFVHQLIFQGMFVAKNIMLSQKIESTIRGNNREANVSIAFFSIFITAALVISLLNQSFGEAKLINSSLAMLIGLLLLGLNLIVSGASLMHLKDSWRVGVIETQKTELISTGIYSFTRNPYFLSYFLIFASYTIILQNLVLLVFSVPGIMIVHKMIMKEEDYLYAVHGDLYLSYKKKVPRYAII